MESGLLTEEQAESHPYRNIITRALGAADRVEVDHLDVTLNSGDLVLLCTDGLTGMVSDEQIKETMAQHSGDLELCTKTLVDAANSNGGQDNITLQVLSYRD
jgi:protein phosphatase